MKANDLLLLKNARVILTDQVVEHTSVLIEQDRIQRIGTEGFPSAIGSVLDLSGLTIFPGFIDVHIHGAVGVDTMDATVEDLLSVSHFLATQGVTSWLPTFVPAPRADYERAVSAIEGTMRQQAESSSGARVLGVHYEGPFVNKMQCGALRSEHFKTFSSAADIEDLPIPDNKGAVSFMTLAPEVDGGIDLVADVVRRGWIASIGHTRASVEILDGAFAAGARHMTHFMNAMAPFNHRAPGPVGWGLSHEDATCDVIADGIHLDPLVLRMLLKAKGSDHLVLISDAIAAAGKGDGEYSIWGQTISVINRRTNNSSGTIAGSVITMLDAVRMMLSLGASEMAVAHMAATNPARLLRVENEYGTVEARKRADLVALDVNREVVLTIINGQIAYRKEI